MSPLHGTVTLTEPYRIAESVCQDLDFDMPRIFEKTFDVKGRVTKRTIGFFPRGNHRLSQLAWLADDAHSPPASATCSLHNQRIPHISGYISHRLWVAR
ncbi:hypothetical protein D9M71_308440 [compost metagenome]